MSNGPAGRLGMRFTVGATNATPSTNRTVIIEWTDGLKSRYHFIWLRQQLFHPAFGHAHSSNPDIPRLPDDPYSLKIKNCTIDGNDLVVNWVNNDEQTRHDLTWLRNNAYDGELLRRRLHQPHYWTGKQANRFSWHDYDTFKSKEDLRWSLYEGLVDKGFVRIRRVPVINESVRELAQWFGPLRTTDFGDISDIKSRPTKKAGRYANIGAGGSQVLGPHTDEGWRYSPPGINFHVCLESTPSAGGESRLYDGFLAAERLRNVDPDSFDFLANTPMRFAAERNDEERYYAHGRLITTDSRGHITGVRFSDRTLGHQDLPSDLVEPAYQALRAFAKQLYSDDLVYRHNLIPGECHIFDNHRVLHGRAAFNQQMGPRHIQQASVDREEFHNRIRLLARKHQSALETVIFANGALG